MLRFIAEFEILMLFILVILVLWSIYRICSSSAFHRWYNNFINPMKKTDVIIKNVEEAKKEVDNKEKEVSKDIERLIKDKRKIKDYKGEKMRK
jgi:uncharacterized membrane protein YqjE